MSDRVLLLFPPATSARFFPYLSLPQLTGYLERRGIETLQSDLNIELTHYLTDPHTLKQFAKNNILSMPPHNRSTQFKEFLAFQKTASYSRQRIFSDDPKMVDERSISSHYILGRLVDIQLGFYGYLKPFRSYEDINIRAIRLLGQNNDPIQVWLKSRIEHLLETFRPTVVMVSTAFGSQLLLGLYITDLIKRSKPKVLTCMGGPFLQAHLDLTSNSNPQFQSVDHVSTGGGEPFLDKFLQETSFRNQRQETSEFGFHDIREMTLPNWKDLPIQAYLNPGFHLGLTSCHGCWWGRCIFCSYGNQSLRRETPYRGKTRAQLLKEISHVISLHAPQQINITDEESNLPTLVSVFRVLNEQGIEMPWNVRYRLGLRLREPDYCQKLADAGCRIIFAGFESTSQRVLDRLDRGILAKDYDKVLENLSRVGIRPRISLCLGLPQETRGEAEDTCRFVIENFGRLELDNLQRMLAEPTSLSGNESDHYNLDLLSDDKLLSNPNTSYAGGRYGRNMACPPEVADLLQEVGDAWKLFSSDKSRSQRRQQIIDNPNWPRFIPGPSLGSGDISFTNDDRSILTNYRLGSEVEISRDLGDFLEKNRNRESVESFFSRSSGGPTKDYELVRDLFVEGFIDLDEPLPLA